MPRGRRRRIAVLVVGLGITGLLLLLVAFPLWFPWVLRPLAARHGLGFGTYERRGYSHFELSQVAYTNHSAVIRAGRVRAVVPTLWWWRCAVARPPQSKAFFQAWDWSYAPTHSTGTHVPGPSPGAKLRGQVAELEHWLPVATLTNGAVDAGKRKVLLPWATWTRGKLAMTAELPAPAAHVELRGDVTTYPFAISVEDDQLHLTSTAQLSTNTGGLKLDSTFYWWSNRVECQAQFGAAGSLPQTASLRASGFRLPSEALGLRSFGDITGSLAGEWSQGQFLCDLDLHADPSLAGARSPLNLKLHANGNTNAVTLQTAALTSTWLTAQLSSNLTVHFTGPILRERAWLTLAADLSRLPWASVQGQLSGHANFTPTPGRFPAAQFDFTGARVGTALLKADSVAVKGEFRWPMLELEEARARFSDGSRALVSGRADLAAKSVAGGQLQFEGPLAIQWLPHGYSFRTMSAQAAFAGPLTNLEHHGSFSISNLSHPPLQPLQLQAKWSGVQSNLDSFDLEATTRAAQLKCRGALALGASRFALNLESLDWTTNGHAALALSRPVRISTAHTAKQKDWHVHLSQTDLVGPAGELHGRAAVDWPIEGHVQMAARNLSSTLLDGFLRTNVPALQLRSLATGLEWSNGPAAYNIDLAVSGLALVPDAKSIYSGVTNQGSGSNGVALAHASPVQLPITAQLSAFGGPQGLVLSNLTLNSQTSTVAHVHGLLPVTFNPATPAEFVRIQPGDPLRLRAVTDPRAFLWTQFSDWTGLTLVRPNLDARVAGTWAAPEGTIDFRAAAVQLRKNPGNLPALDSVHLRLELGRAEARLTIGECFVQGQPIKFTGRLPLGESFWAGLPHRKRPAWDQLEGTVRVEEAELAAFASLFPAVLAPQGTLDMTLSISPGFKLGGGLTLQRARTRPLGNFGPIRDINIRMRFQTNAFELENASAQLGGAPVALTGRADLSGEQWLKGVMPPFRLTLRGKDVPLARQPDLIVRGDLELLMTKTNGTPPLVSGAVHLHDSYYLSDLRALIPGKVASPSRRPPYFSVDEPSVADWRLAVDVDGVRFMKARSPLFAGEATANLKLAGTLKDPIALGDLRIDSGVVRFPFASLNVQQGLITLSSQDPYRPQITLTAGSKQYSYDIRLEVSGAVDQPNIQFSSTPPLTSEQILLMVTAGQMPQGSFTLTPQQRAQTLAVFLARDMLAKMGFGDQAEQRLTIRSGEEISEQGRPTYGVEYKLADRWSLVGEYDRFGDFNAGIKWRVFSK